MGDGRSTVSDALRRLGFSVDRFKTGTPCRLHGLSIDFDALTQQNGDSHPPLFSFLSETLRSDPEEIFTLNPWGEAMFHVEQIPCWIGYTNETTHEIIRSNLDKSPMFSGKIEGIGPRYCPSIEDKVVRFADKERHQIFLEPEGRHTREFYVNGVSTSLPMEVQYAFIRSIRGLENAAIIRPGYAVEYDYCPPIPVASHPRDKEDRRTLLCRANQWHQWLRGSRGTRTSRRSQRCSQNCRKAPPSLWGATNPTSA